MLVIPSLANTDKPQVLHHAMTTKDQIVSIANTSHVYQINVPYKWLKLKQLIS